MMHDAGFVELPILIAVRAIPIAGIVMPFIGEAHCDAVCVKRPKLLDEPVVQFALPFPGQEFDNLLSTRGELSAIAPFTVYRISKCDLLRISRVPSIFGLPDFCSAISRVNGGTRFNACCALIS